MIDLSAHITRLWSHLKGKKIYLGCSGGVDSMTLLYLLHVHRFDVEAVHVNYQLRGKDSEEDEQLVERICRTRNIPFHVQKINLQEILDREGGNLQEKARDIRYSFFEDFLNRTPEALIALAHHRDDQTETFFMNLARKSGIMGLCCMAKEHDRYIRPLLSFLKETIREFARTNHIEWREDRSNASDKYTRNLLRNRILPEIRQQIPSLDNSVSILISAFQSTQEELEKNTALIKDVLLDTQRLSFSTYDQLTTFEKVELLRQLGQKASLLPYWEQIRFSQKGKKILFESNQWNIGEIIREEDHFFFKPVLSNNDFFPELIVETVHSLPSQFEKDVLYIDPSKLSGELQLRKWNIGDRMEPLGMNGSKLISDIIKDAKIPHHQRQDVWVVTDSEKIIWCVGIKIGKKATARNNSREILKISIRKVV